RCDEEGRWKGFNVKLLEGDNHWPAVMRALRDIGYRDWVITEQGGGDSPEGLRELVERVEKILSL
ncbi:MAG TPA: sugar phosphate isomerase/epimerase, partial [Verrucomicrobiota bacterium]|nr:sugar phosphate isomerase/epimerase [Verrucomicrobiota bacterium]